MERTAVWCLMVLLGCLATGAYRVHEDEPKDDETICEKCQSTSATVIDGIFNMPTAATNLTSEPAQTSQPKKPGKIDSELKTPVKTSEAKSKLSRKVERRYDQVYVAVVARTSTTTTPDPRGEQVRKAVEAQREQQRVYQRQVRRRQLELLQQYSKRLQQRILEQDERRFYRVEPFGFNALAKWIVGPRGIVFNGHAGHGDGHVYQYYDARKPLPFGGQPTRLQDDRRAAPTTPLASSTTTDSSVAGGRQTKVIGPTHLYAVHEVVDEGANPFTWPNWLGILSALSVPTSTYPTLDTDKKLKAKLEQQQQQQLKQNNEAPKDQDFYSSNYAKARKNDWAREEEIANNEIDSELTTSAERDGKVLLLAAN